MANSYGQSYEQGRLPDGALWPSILPTLKGLCIIGNQPINDLSNSDSSTFAEKIDEWTKWISPFLQCFGQILLSEAIVEVDTNGQQETINLVETYLPAGYRDIQCPLGDLIFNRGYFSQESRFWGEEYNDYDYDTDAPPDF